MDADTAIIDISSDEEDWAVDSFDLSEEWINELLGYVDTEVKGDLDDLMVLDELSVPSCMKKLSPLQKDSDDDCLVLDGDPDNVTPVVDGKHNSTDMLDDLVVVGEKGHLACRDYPHPRHLCINFPFKSTSHEKHCKLCHCYVCDSPAPCIYWGTGILATDHCHSSEKEKRWKVLRSNFKLGITTASETHQFPKSNSHTQPFRSSQLLPVPCLQNLNRSSTRFAAAMPVSSIQRERRPPVPSIDSFKTRPVNQRTTHPIQPQSYPITHATLRTLSGPVYHGSASNRSSGVSSRDRSVSKELQKSVPIYHGSTSNRSSGVRDPTVFKQLQKSTHRRSSHSSVWQVSHRKPLASPHANSHPAQPEASNNMDKIRGILASIEADLLDTEVSSPFRPLSKPSVLTSASQNVDVFGAYISPKSR